MAYVYTPPPLAALKSPESEGAEKYKLEPLEKNTVVLNTATCSAPCKSDREEINDKLLDVSLNSAGN